jgi:hypothetical protein
MKHHSFFSSINFNITKNSVLRNRISISITVVSVSGYFIFLIKVNLETYFSNIIFIVEFLNLTSTYCCGTNGIIMCVHRAHISYPGPNRAQYINKHY